METESVDVPEVIYVEDTSVVSTLTSGNANSSDEGTREIKRLTLELTAARAMIAQQNAREARQVVEAGRSNSSEIEVLIKVVEQERSQRLEKEEELGKLKKLVKSLAEQFFVVTDKKVILEEVKEGNDEKEQRNHLVKKDAVVEIMKSVKNGFERGKESQGMTLETKVHILGQEMQTLKKMFNLHLKQSTAPPEKTTGIAIPTTNEEGGVVPPTQPINDGGAVEQVEMPESSGNSGSGAPVVIIDGNGDVSRESSSLSPRPADPIFDDDDKDDDENDAADAELIENEETGEKSPRPAKRVRMTNVKHRPIPKEVKKGIFKCKCKKIYQSDVHLKKHIGYHKKERTIPCPICGKKFSSPCYLKPHLKNGHKFGTERTRGKWAKAKGRQVAQAAHKITMEPPKGKRTKGRQVGGSTIRKQNNDKKKSVHSQVSSSSSDIYTCECGKTFASLPDLKKHIPKKNRNKKNKLAA